MSALSNILSQPRLAYYYAQKAVRVLLLRKAMAAVAAWAVRLRAGAPPAPAGEGLRMAQELAASGFSALPGAALTAEQVQSVVATLSAAPLLDYYGGPAVHSLQAGIPRSVLKARYAQTDVMACNPLMDVVNHPDILAAVGQRLGAPATIASVEAWWTFGEHNDAGSAAFDDIYHRDVDDLRFIKLFVYLTDATLATGAHRFILGSHADAQFARRGAISEAQVEAAYRPDQVKTVTGQAGTGFLEDTWGIHRALLATEGRRLIFSCIYVLAAHMPGNTHRPAQALPHGYGRYANRRLFA